MEQFNAHGDDEDAAGINHDNNDDLFDSDEFSDEDEYSDESSDEGESSDDEGPDGPNAQMRRQIEGNDPALIKLKIGLGLREYFPYRYGWESDGKSVGKNTQIKELILSDLDESYGRTTKQNLEKFSSGAAHNRSIKKISFRQCNLFDGEIFRILVPFFKDNCSFECLQMENCYPSPECIHLLTTALAQFDSLTEIILCCDNEIDENRARELIRVLTGHSGLRKIILPGVRIGRDGCVTLATFLQNPKSKLAVLNLTNNGIGNEGAAVLATGLTGNSTLKDLDISVNEDITVAGWGTIFSTLHSPNCGLEKLNLACNGFKDEMVSLANALTNNSSLRSLSLSDNPEISMAGWEAFSSVLQNPNCVLEELNLSSIYMDGEAVNFISDALINNTALKSLNLSENGINDEAINNLTNALVNNTKLRELDLSVNPSVTVTGLEAFTTVLQNPVSALEKLDLQYNSINDATLVSLANSLANNNKLKDLLAYNFDFTATNGWAAFSHVVCSTSSIMDTYHSNHTLQRLVEDDDKNGFTEDLRSLLRINRENSKSAAARLKIIKTHFREGFIVRPFVDMESKVLPHAIAWMGRDGRTSEVNGHFYGFLRSMPLLFDVDRKIKERRDTSLLDVDSKNRKRKMED